jgi:hypothetical protein
MIAFLCIRVDIIVYHVKTGLYKGKGDKYDSKIHRGISLLSIPRKLYERILISRVQKMTGKYLGRPM